MSEKPQTTKEDRANSKKAKKIARKVHRKVRKGQSEIHVGFESPSLGPIDEVVYDEVGNILSEKNEGKEVPFTVESVDRVTGTGISHPAHRLTLHERDAATGELHKVQDTTTKSLGRKAIDVINKTNKFNPFIITTNRTIRKQNEKFEGRLKGAGLSLEDLEPKKEDKEPDYVSWERSKKSKK